MVKFTPPTRDSARRASTCPRRSAWCCSSASAPSSPPPLATYPASGCPAPAPLVGCRGDPRSPHPRPRRPRGLLAGGHFGRGLHALGQAEDDGHTLLPEDALVEQGAALLGAG